MNNDMQRDFKGVWIPKEVWLDDRLNALDKVILVEIDSLDQSERGCYASNKHLATFCQCSETKISTAISKLIKLGYIYIQSFDGRQRELKSRLTNFKRQDIKNCNSDFKNLKQSNTSNNTENNTKSKKKESKQTSFDDIILDYAGTKDVNEVRPVIDLLQEWLKVRKAKRAAMTDRAIQMNINKLDEIAKQSNMTVIEYLEQVIMRGWAAFYVINNYNNKQQTEQKKDNTPNWTIPGLIEV